MADLGIHELQLPGRVSMAHVAEQTVREVAYVNHELQLPGRVSMAHIAEQTVREVAYVNQKPVPSTKNMAKATECSSEEMMASMSVSVVNQ